MFADYSSTVKAMRKIAHGALKAYGDGLVQLEQSVLEEADALFKRFDKKNGEGFDPMPDLGKILVPKLYFLFVRDELSGLSLDVS